jgi:hypothetical protein
MIACRTCGYRTFAEIPPVPAPNLLRSNDVPSPEEALSIQATLSVVNQDLWRLTNEIRHAQTNLHNLLRNHTTLRAFYHRQTALLSPSRRLPPEILSEIFLEYLISCQEGDTFPARKDVLLTTQISRHWRQVAISTPRLWSALCFDLRVQNASRELEMGPIWLSRSGGAPLTLGLHSYNEISKSHPITKMILPHAPRWVTLILNTTPSIIHSLRIAKDEVRRLRSLIIRSNFASQDPTLPQSFDAFKFALQLRSLTFVGQVSVLKPEFACAQLRELRLYSGHYTVNDCLQMLYNSPNLEICEIRPSPSQDHPPSRTVVTNYNLRELNISDCDLASLFTSLALPALRNLSCDCCNAWPKDEFLSFMHRSSFTLLKLVLSGIYDYGYCIAECLRHTANLVELALLEGCGDAIGEEFLRDMTHDSSPSVLLPKLRCMKVDRERSFAYDAFATMVESRWRVSPPQGAPRAIVERIQRVEICFIDGYEDYEDYDTLRDNAAYSNSFARLRQLQAEGLALISPDIEPDR